MRTRGVTLIEVLIMVCIAAVIIGLAGRSCVGINPTYSTGERVAVVTKLSEKGVIWKSLEGEALMSLPGSQASATQPEKFEFNVAPQARAKVEAALASGARVKLIYQQWWSKPLTIDNDHVIVDVKPTEP